MRARRLLLLPLLLAVFLLGVLRDTAASEDALRIHVVCPEHGELLHANVTRRDHAEIKSAETQKAHSGCTLAELGPLPSVVPELPPTLVLPEARPLIARSAAPRGPPPGLSPLVCAPKTSPPRMS
jgi:hypothetical protein